MPTNTHTFFYRTVINDKVITDISTTSGYLNQIENNSKNTKHAQLREQEIRNKTNILLGELEAEIKNEANPGFGPKSKEILRKIAKEVDVAKIEPLSYKGKSEQERIKLCDAYRKKIMMLSEAKINNVKNHILRPDNNNLKEVKTEKRNLALLKKYIEDKTIDLNNAEDMTGTNGVCDKLNEAYNVVKKNKDFVDFNPISDKEVYTAASPVTKVKRMVSVFDVWKDLLKGEYKGQGFVFWIIISVLVDLAAFIFFTLAFKKEDF